ncbi:hypothetical protein TorRG33x02_312660, partial [Trema orientale]
VGSPCHCTSSRVIFSVYNTMSPTAEYFYEIFCMDHSCPTLWSDVILGLGDWSWPVILVSSTLIDAIRSFTSWEQVASGQVML